MRTKSQLQTGRSTAIAIVSCTDRTLPGRTRQVCTRLPSVRPHQFIRNSQMVTAGEKRTTGRQPREGTDARSWEWFSLTVQTSRGSRKSPRDSPPFDSGASEIEYRRPQSPWPLTRSDPLAN